jgi:RNA polymerase sigma factor (TIGR02999 family)
MASRDDSTVPTPSQAAVTTLLMRWRQGDRSALDDVLPLVYQELRRMARVRLREKNTQSLQPTALVHEVYVRLVDRACTTIHDRTHFFALAARVMRQVLADQSRRRLADKRGGGVKVVTIDDAEPIVRSPDIEVVALDQALEKLASFDERLCRIVELKFFAGLTINEIAEALDLSTATVEREWAIAKAWLRGQLSSHARRA